MQKTKSQLAAIGEKLREEWSHLPRDPLPARLQALLHEFKTSAEISHRQDGENSRRRERGWNPLTKCSVSTQEAKQHQQNDHRDRDAEHPEKNRHGTSSRES
jgi:hypothetical protein